MERPTGTAAVRARRPPATLRRALLDAAELEFATHGFDAASTRSIAERAGAHQPQINYHFSSKEQLWRDAVDRLFAELDAALVVGLTGAEGVPVFAAVVERFLRFSAVRPALNRIINLEATAPSPRLDWLVETHLAPRFDQVAGGWIALRMAGAGAELTPEEVWAIITSFGALHFANAPMLARLGDGHAVTVDQQVERTLRLLGLPTRTGEKFGHGD
ncbi:MAG TPA: TetR/AcrR family transcriptional regulator [Acidimicrobiales bacterium]|nr:TetR/AcrR family transcriptional regulator [Acidimicrobiales bacterium]